jgi:hypothetical protein
MMSLDGDPLDTDWVQKAQNADSQKVDYAILLIDSLTEDKQKEVDLLCSFLAQVLNDRSYFILLY